jgi:hypothetical protein
MSRVLTLAAAESIVCPACKHAFPLEQGIGQSVLEHYADAHEKQVAAERERLRAEAELALRDRHAADLTRLQEDLARRDAALKDSRSREAKLVADTRAAAAEEAAGRQKFLEQQLADLKQSLAAQQAKELQFLKEREALETEKRNLELNVQRRLVEEREAIQTRERAALTEEFQLKEAELKQKIAQAQAQAADLKQKLEQGSMQTQGEVLELALEADLRAAFPQDLIEEVGKGQLGADVKQQVRTPVGLPCGLILWETKRAKHWANDWAVKLGADKLQAGAAVAVLVTTAFPADEPGPFFLRHGIWVVRPPLAALVATALREQLLAVQNAQRVNEGRDTKMAQLYDFLCSPAFGDNLRTVARAYTDLQTDIVAERAAMEKLWKRREKRLALVAGSLAHIVGGIEAIAQGDLPALDGIHSLGASDPGDE